MSTAPPAVKAHEMTRPQPKSASNPAADAPVRARFRARPGAWATLRDNALVTVLGSAVVGLVIFTYTSLDRDIDRLEDQMIERLAAQDERIDRLEDKVDRLEDKVDRLDDKIDEVNLKLTALIARLEESGTIRALGDSAAASAI